MSTEFATKDDLAERLAEVGVDLGNVISGHGSPRIDVAYLGGGRSELVLIVQTYSLNSDGKRYIDHATLQDEDGPKAATETRRFFITKDWRLSPAPELRELSTGRVISADAMRDMENPLFEERLL